VCPPCSTTSRPCATCSRPGGALRGAREPGGDAQLEPQEWYLRIEGELMADSILGRTVSVARYLDLEGPNMREYFRRMRDGKDGTK
jgi:hypothetical protein